jgi:hypothetical protein
MVAVTINGSRNLSDGFSVAEYLKILQIAQVVDRTASSFEDYNQSPCPIEATTRLIEAGLTAWDSPKFCEYAAHLVSSAYSQGKFEIAKFVSRFLLESLPDRLPSTVNDPYLPDGGWREFYQSYIDGTHHLVSHSRFCKYPRSSEFYLKTLNWKMVELAEDAELSRRADRSTYWAMRQVGRGEEYLSGHVARSIAGEV